MVLGATLLILLARRMPSSVCSFVFASQRVRVGVQPFISLMASFHFIKPSKAAAAASSGRYPYAKLPGRSYSVNIPSSVPMSASMPNIGSAIYSSSAVRRSDLFMVNSASNCSSFPCASYIFLASFSSSGFNLLRSATNPSLFPFSNGSAGLNTFDNSVAPVL
ncbi:MAG: hypothetical protein JW847_05650 [Candidatus Omnitrophica bacterium]|nr:hypothetical protein [Candidatus Omnitrophota bacterium]